MQGLEQVLKGSPAERLYQRFGFQETGRGVLRAVWSGGTEMNASEAGADRKGLFLMHKPKIGNSRRIGRYIANASIWMAATALVVHAQGILSVTPGRTISSTTGSGAVGIGYTGDGGMATSTTLASPSAVAYDVNGNLFLADAMNHVVREVTKGGNIATVAGSGVAGFGG